MNAPSSPLAPQLPEPWVFDVAKRLRGPLTQDEEQDLWSRAFTLKRNPGLPPTLIGPFRTSERAFLECLRVGDRVFPIVEALFERQARQHFQTLNQMAKDELGCSALVLAVYGHSLAIVDLLVQAHGDTPALSLKGQDSSNLIEALYAAIGTQHWPIAHRLLEEANPTDVIASGVITDAVHQILLRCGANRRHPAEPTRAWDPSHPLCLEHAAFVTRLWDLGARLHDQRDSDDHHQALHAALSIARNVRMEQTWDHDIEGETLNTLSSTRRTLGRF